MWKEIVNDLLSEFEYPDGDGLVTGWRVAGRDNPILIDPRIAFGEPQVSGVATWVILNRWESGENLDDIAEDYDLERDSVISALKFEGVDIDYRRPSQWVH